MNWKQEAVRDLKAYPLRLESRDNIRDRIELLEEQFLTLKGINAGEPVMGGLSRQEEKWLNNITEREQLGFSLQVTQALIELTEKGLAVLSKEERTVLEGFYLNKEFKHVEGLCSILHIEKSRLYEIKDEALRKFTVAMYGVVEL